MSDVPDKIIIDDDTGQIRPKAEHTSSQTMFIEINGKKEEVKKGQAWTLAMSILYQLRLMDEQR